MAGFSQWFADGRTKGIIQASNRWHPGSGKWRALLGGQHAAPVNGLSPEVYITSAFEKDPTVMGNLDTTPLSLTSIPTTHPEHTQQYNPPLLPYLHTCTHNIPTHFSPTTHT